MKMNSKKIRALPSLGRDPNSELRRRLILGTALIVFRGLSTLIVLSALKLADGI